MVIDSIRFDLIVAKGVSPRAITLEWQKKKHDEPRATCSSLKGTK